MGLPLPTNGSRQLDPKCRSPTYVSFSLLNPGYLRDVTGNYTASFVVAGAFLLAGSGVLITLPHFFSCISLSTSRPQDLVIEAPDTKIPLPKEEGLGEN